MMQLADDWRAVLRHAWSIRLMLIAGLLSAIEVVLSMVAPASLPVSPLVFGALSGLVTMAAFIARLVAQQQLPPAQPQPEPQHQFEGDKL